MLLNTSIQFQILINKYSIVNCIGWFYGMTFLPKIFKLKIKDNKIKVRNIHLHIFHILFKGLRSRFEFGIGLELVFVQGFEFGLNLGQN